MEKVENEIEALEKVTGANMVQLRRQESPDGSVLSPDGLVIPSIVCAQEVPEYCNE
jgi:hypothetical protein